MQVAAQSDMIGGLATGVSSACWAAVGTTASGSNRRRGSDRGFAAAVEREKARFRKRGLPVRAERFRAALAALG